MTADPRLLQRAVSESPGTVTQFLEALVGEALIALVVRQSEVEPSTDDHLDVTAGETTMQRIALLKGCSSDVPYLWAESAYVPERLPEGVRAELMATSDPIGRVLTRHGLGLEKKALPSPHRPGSPAPDAFAAFSSEAAFSPEVVWSRAYRLVVGGRLAFAVREWFLRPALDALELPGPSGPGRPLDAVAVAARCAARRIGPSPWWGLGRLAKDPVGRARHPRS